MAHTSLFFVRSIMVNGMLMSPSFMLYIWRAISGGSSWYSNLLVPALGLVMVPPLIMVDLSSENRATANSKDKLSVIISDRIESRRVMAFCLSI